MPERLASRRVECLQPTRSAREDQVARGAEELRLSAALPGMGPSDLPGLVVDGLQHRLGKSAAIGAAPPGGIVAGVVEVVDAEGACGVDVEEARLRAERR